MRTAIFRCLGLLVLGLAVLTGASDDVFGAEPAGASRPVAGGQGPRSADSVRPVAERPQAGQRIPDANLRIPESLKPCAENLEKIHAAIEKYREDKGVHPDWLSALVPDYLEASDLLCPVEVKEKAAYWPDPKMPCSYTYEFSGHKLSNNWGPVGGLECREWKARQVRLFGDVVPVIRCFHKPQVISISFGGQAFWGLEVWERVFKPDYQRGDELSAAERPFRYVLPVGGADDLVKYIARVKAFRPRTPYQKLDHARRAPLALRAAATMILRTEKDEWSTAYQTALRVLIEQRISRLGDAHPVLQRETVNHVKTLLVARQQRALTAEDADLALSVIRSLQQSGSLELASSAGEAFAEILATSDEQAVLKATKELQTLVDGLQPVPTAEDGDASMR